LGNLADRRQLITLFDTDAAVWIRACRCRAHSREDPLPDPAVLRRDRANLRYVGQHPSLLYGSLGRSRSGHLLPCRVPKGAQCLSQFRCLSRAKQDCAVSFVAVGPVGTCVFSLCFSGSNTMPGIPILLDNWRLPPVSSDLTKATIKIRAAVILRVS